MGLSHVTRHQNGRGKPTNVICVELVDADQNADGRGPERPSRQGTKNGELALVEIVNEDRIELFRREVSDIKSIEQFAALPTPM